MDTLLPSGEGVRSADEGLDNVILNLFQDLTPNAEDVRFRNKFGMTFL